MNVMLDLRRVHAHADLHLCTRVARQTKPLVVRVFEVVQTDRHA